MNRKLKVLMSGGGTGGHIFPAIAIADEIKKRFPEAEFWFSGANGKMEMEKVPQAGYKIIGLNIAVAVNLIPVTGQPLPLISYGGTSMLVTYLQLGIILNVSSRIQVYDEEGMGKKQDLEEINDIA